MHHRQFLRTATGCAILMSAVTAGLLIVAAHAAEANSPRAVALGDQLQLFLDDALIDTRRGVELRLHEPRQAETVLVRDRPYEDTTMYDPVVIKDGDRYRMWYRANFNSAPYYMAYAESSDGITWTKPSLGLIEVRGSKDNNLIWSAKDVSGPHSWSVFKDPNPAVPADERYKAMGDCGYRRPRRPWGAGLAGWFALAATRRPAAGAHGRPLRHALGRHVGRSEKSIRGLHARVDKRRSPNHPTCDLKRLPRLVAARSNRLRP